MLQENSGAEDLTVRELLSQTPCTICVRSPIALCDHLPAAIIEANGRLTVTTQDLQGDLTSILV